MCYSLQHTWGASFSQSVLRSSCSQQFQHTGKMDSGGADSVRFWNGVEKPYDVDQNMNIHDAFMKL